MSDFGYRNVTPEEKTRLVGRVFSSVASRYDLMNDLMSVGIHRLWKRHFVTTMALRPGIKLLDLAGGTGDVATLALDRVCPGGRVMVADINADMLRAGQRRMDDSGQVGGLHWLQVNAEALPFADRSFDRVSIAFGLRNVTDRDRALLEMFRVLRPGGQVHILEFSPSQPEGLKALYELWSFQVLPRLGAAVAGDADSYRYLAESIRRFPPPEELSDDLERSGFEGVGFERLSQGICCIHRGFRA